VNARSTLTPPDTEIADPKIIDPSDLDHRVSKAIDRLLEKDDYLLRHDANERSITHRLACYLQEEFPEYDVDCEYNKDCDSKNNIKMLNTNRRKNGRVFPDIIVHKRGTNSKNLLVIEAKKTNGDHGNSNSDREKLYGYLTEYEYKYALFLKFRTGDVNVGLEECVWMCKCRHSLRKDTETRS
jgi:hypothetical protein